MNSKIWAGIEQLEARRLLSSGQLDPTFGAGGIVYDPTQSKAVGMVVQGDGKILVAASDFDAGVVERFNADGTLDSTFGSAGRIAMDFSIIGIGLDSSGNVLVGGQQSGTDYGPSTWYVERLAADGSPSPFASGSARVILPQSNLGGRYQAQFFGVQADDKIIIGGTVQEPTADPVPGNLDHLLDLERLNSDGSIDTSFGAAGEASFAAQPIEGAHLLFRSNGQIVAVCSAALNEFFEYGLAETFSYDGTPLATETFGQHLGAVFTSGAILSNGELATYGDIEVNPAWGSVLDISGSTSQFLMNATGPIGPVYAMAALPGGKFMMATGGDHEIGLARLNSNGSNDQTFGTDGANLLQVDPVHDGWSRTEGISVLANAANGDVLAAGNYNGHLLLLAIDDSSQTPAATGPMAGLQQNNAFNGTIQFVLKYTGSTPIDVSTLSTQNILVTGPNGYSEHPSTMSVSTMTPGVPVEVNLTFAGLVPGGQYQIHMLPNQVSDTMGRYVPAGVIDTLYLSGLAPGMHESDIVTPYILSTGPTAGIFQVRISSTDGVDVSSLNNQNFYLTEPESTARFDAVYLGETTSHDGRSVVASYRVDPPSGAPWGGTLRSPQWLTLWANHSPLTATAAPIFQSEGLDQALKLIPTPVGPAPQLITSTLSRSKRGYVTFAVSYSPRLAPLDVGTINGSELLVTGQQGQTLVATLVRNRQRQGVDGLYYYCLKIESQGSSTHYYVSLLPGHVRDTFGNVSAGERLGALLA